MAPLSDINRDSWMAYNYKSGCSRRAFKETPRTRRMYRMCLLATHCWVIRSHTLIHLQSCVPPCPFLISNFQVKQFPLTPLCTNANCHLRHVRSIKGEGPENLWSTWWHWEVTGQEGRWKKGTMGQVASMCRGEGPWPGSELWFNSSSQL